MLFEGDGLLEMEYFEIMEPGVGLKSRKCAFATASNVASLWRLASFRYCRLIRSFLGLCMVIVCWLLLQVTVYGGLSALADYNYLVDLLGTGWKGKWWRRGESNPRPKVFRQI
jgi:hypothetical protein